MKGKQKFTEIEAQKIANNCLCYYDSVGFLTFLNSKFWLKKLSLLSPNSQRLLDASSVLKTRQSLLRFQAVCKEHLLIVAATLASN